ncbi:MAG: glycosyltransferase [Anaerolineae bacterium]|nr:glycosyltransferase [Anaerolineae bacterium]
MPEDKTADRKPHCVWLYTEPAADRLDAATWLSTTRELRNLGWDVTLVVVGPDGPDKVRGVDVLNISRPDIYFLGQVIFHFKAAWMILRQWRNIDVILFHQMSVIWLMPLRVLRLFSRRRRPLFVVDTRTLHMLPPDQETLRDRLRRWFYILMDWLSNSLADGRLAITKRMAEVLNIPGDQLWGVWTSGVDAEQFQPALVDRRWPEEGEPVNLVYIGLQHYERNLMALSRAVALANQEGMAFRLILVGEGQEHEKLTAFAAQTGDLIDVRPPVPHAEIPAVLAEAHVGTLPFPDEEKFRVSSPIKLFEYMAAGLPVMATAIVCHTDVMEDDYAFWARGSDVERLLDALRDIWQKRGSLQEMGRLAAEASNRWTWAGSASNLKAALEKGMKQTSSRK